MENNLTLNNQKVNQKKINQGEPFLSFPVNLAKRVHAQGNATNERKPWGMAVRSKNDVAAAYADWFKEFDDMWNLYAHYTFRLGNTKHGSIHPERANKLFNQSIDNLNKEIFGRHYKKHSEKGVLVARSTEIGGLGGLLHYHALLGRIPADVQRMELKEKWNDLAGFARIYKYDRSLGGAAYIAKSAYAWKRGEVDFLGPWGSIKSIMRESYQVLPLFVAGDLQAS